MEGVGALEGKGILEGIGALEDKKVLESIGFKIEVLLSRLRFLPIEATLIAIIVLKAFSLYLRLIILKI